jgi:hypothetical protein
MKKTSMSWFAVLAFFAALVMSTGPARADSDGFVSVLPYSGWSVPADISKLATPSAWNRTVERHRTPQQIHLASANSLYGSL